MTPRGSGRLASSRASVSDVARLAGVSPMTVSRVVNGTAYVSPGMVSRVERALAELDFVPSELARALSSGSLGVIALVVPDLTHPWFTACAHALEVAARAEGMTVMIGNSDADLEVERRHLERTAALRGDGLVLSPASDASAAALRAVRAAGTRLVLLDRELPGVAADVVLGESTEAAATLVDHLVHDHGRRRIALVTGPEDVSTSRERTAGWRRATSAAGLPNGPQLLRCTRYERAAGHAASLELLNRPGRPDAVLAGNSLLAFGVLDAVRELGLRVPEDVALVTFDDVETFAVQPFLTCAERSPRAIGTAAFELLMQESTNGPRQVVVPADLTYRGSCGCG